MKEESEPKETGFLRRPAHTEAEDWIVYHPDITPTAFLLYMRLRGAVMDPSSSAEDWKKISRFSVEQMRRLLPRTKVNSDKGDPGYAGKRTVQDSLALLVGIGALRRVATKGTQIPVYDFPMYPPDTHTGPIWGGAVAQTIRDQVKVSERRASVTESDKKGCDTPHGVRYTAPPEPKGCDTPHGGCDTPHGFEAVTCDDGASKKLFEKNPLPPQEEDEDDASLILRSLTAKHQIEIHGEDRTRAMRTIWDLIADGWTKKEIHALLAHTNWRRVTVPDRYVLSKLEGAVGTIPVRTGAEQTQDTLESLKARREAQKAAIAACSGCGDYGRAPRSGWHGHDDEDLKNRIWALEQPDEAAALAEMAAQSA